jgi:hypothetical protein
MLAVLFFHCLCTQFFLIFRVFDNIYFYQPFVRNHKGPRSIIELSNVELDHIMNINTSKIERDYVAPHYFTMAFPKNENEMYDNSITQDVQEESLKTSSIAIVRSAQNFVRGLESLISTAGQNAYRKASEIMTKKF